MKNNTIEKDLRKEIPALDPRVEAWFWGADKARKKIPITEVLNTMPQKLITIPNIPIQGSVMARPGYYKNMQTNDPWVGELADMAPGNLQSSPLVKVRPEIKGMLDEWQKVLDRLYGYLKLVVLDWYRSLLTQKELFEMYRNQLQKAQSLPTEVSYIEAQKMVSIPPKDKKDLEFRPPPHSTWGSVDVILADIRWFDIHDWLWLENSMLDFGARFDEMLHPRYGDERSCTRFLEQDKILKDTEAGKNRRLLYNLLTGLWFSNYHTEWRHYDFGNQFNALTTGKSEAKYWFAWGFDGKVLIEDRTDEHIAYLEYIKHIGKYTTELTRTLDAKELFGIMGIIEWQDWGTFIKTPRMAAA